MGVDWYRMRPRKGMSKSHLSHAIEEQAAACRVILPPGPGHAGGEIGLDHEATEKAVKWSQVLDALLVVEKDEPGQIVCWRIYPIAYNSVFPPEERLRAYRTILPDELPEQVARWMAWMDGVRNGAYESYLSRLYLHEISLRLCVHGQLLREAAQATLDSVNAWAKKEKFLRVREEVLKLEPRVPPPSLVDSPSRPGRATEREIAARDRVLEESHYLVDLTKRWNACQRTRRKLSHFEKPYENFEQFKRSADTQWQIDDFFSWVRGCCEDEVGLLLDF